MSQNTTQVKYSTEVNSSKSLPGAEKRPGVDYTAPQSSISVLISDNPSWQDLIRAERTVGGPAVSEGIRDGDPGGAGSLPPSPSVPAPSKTNASPDTGVPLQKTTRLVGFSKLRSLLQPVHEWFQDKVGFIKSFRIYDDKENDLAYPEVKVWHRDNPYRRHQLVHKASARTYKKLRRFADGQGLDDFMVASIVLTMPKFISEYLADKGISGRGLAWRLFDGWWAEDLHGVIPQDIQFGSHTNLHLWRTEVPISPHYHFHTLIPNYGLVESDVLEDEDGNPAYEFKRWEWHRQRGGRVVPFSEEQLNELKELWRARLQRFCKRHGLEYIEGKVDIYVEYIDLWPKLLHRLNYNGRHWSENYAEYSNENPDCPAPPEWLQHYENKARVKGWWSNLRNMFKSMDQEKEKLSPYTGETMEYKDKFGFEGMVIQAGGQLGKVEFVRGQPVEGQLSEEEITWLKGVMCYEAEMPDVEALELDTT